MPATPRSSAAREFDTGLHGQHHDPGAGRALQHSGDHLDARLAGHVEVQHQDRGLVPERVASRVLGGLGLGHHLDVALLLEHHADAVADDRVIVSEDHRDALPFPRPFSVAHPTRTLEG